MIYQQLHLTLPAWIHDEVEPDRLYPDADSRIALRRGGRVEEIMGAIVFLASDASSLATGSALMLDGGWSAA